jgi:hypothetical protein
VTQRAEAALALMQKYLLDAVEPAVAADAVATLMAQPPEILMRPVGDWSLAVASRTGRPVADLLLYALQKIYITGELGLLDSEAVASYLDRLTGVALRICPTEQRDQLRSNLASMRMSRTRTAARVDMPIEQLRTTTMTNVPLPAVDEDAELAKRFALIVERLQRQAQTNPRSTQDAPAPADQQTFAQLLTMAASRSQSGQQFNDYVKMIQPLTGGKEGNVFVILGGAMPSWDTPNFAPGVGGPPPAQVGAMEKIIDLAENATVTMTRVRELITAAIQKFNEGALAAALWMFDVAEDTIREKKLDPAVVEKIRSDAADSIAAVQLRKYTENRARHGALKIALDFFPTLRLDTLLEQLRGEPKADRRRSLLGFIEAYGTIGRAAALNGLQHELTRGDVDTYFLRNLIYILHRVTRASDDGVALELELLGKASARGQNIYVIKEAATALGQIRSDEAVTLITTRLVEFEALLLRSDASMYPISEMQKLLDRLTGSLARIGTSAALLTVARHGMKANALLGDTRARLAALAMHDLSFDEATVNVLVKALRDEIPGKLFGRSMPKKQDSTLRLIEALSGTRSDAADELFLDIATRFADQDVGRAASTVLEKSAPPKPSSGAEPVATLTGELEFFGLPSVMQSLAEMRATGMLTLTNKQRQAASKLIFVEGKFLNARTAHVRGVDALYEVLERPLAGTFAFVPYSPEKMQGSTDEPLAIMGLLLEGMRRHDELQRLIALVPDDMCLTKGSTKPTPDEEENDPALVREVWIKASSGLPVAECERQLSTDGFRVRRLVAHWVEHGALVAN